ncbi:flagellar basal-body MS-ring/collar protein FliF [Piscinibacter sakaiensis]|uniref:Flagellar M-ring protein n=1 Tax=Piscinibacter sakaiensis TaxID=1547922 RepID=A0A0K8P6T0_PISS1|nr:flagellar basal-body MS-ring/collar protein FliF [Piscinibacter sakaiensis]GAP38224.1 flagellar M-ring protein FliF [Piscinibacter sakaiensis]
MDNVVAANPTPLVPATGFGARLAALPVRSKMMLGTGIAGLVAIATAMLLWGSQGDYKVLFANLADKDANAILQQLDAMNVPRRLGDNGGAILVPADKVHEVRLKLAASGLPKGSVVGFELMDNARFGQTQFQERLTFQRGLEGELTRTITAMDAVENARVHLALPNQNGFFREQQKPTASVMLTLRGGRTLDRSQIAGIVNLVSRSVPEMSAKSVSVLDQTGALLSQTDGAQAGLDAQQLQYVNQIESSYTKRILELLEPVVGRENLRANVTAEVDFSQSEATSEEFKPNQGNDARVTVRSQQSSEQNGSTATMPTGVPGAASNTPPTNPTAQLTGTPPPLQTAGAGSNGNSRREAVTNYEVDKTVRVTRNATGAIKRINAAVVVNHRTTLDPKGKPVTTALSAEEIDKLTALVQESVGFSKDRGDSVKVVNAPFKVEPVEKNELPWWKQPEVLDLLRAGGVPAALAFLGLLIVFGLVRPAVKAALAPPPPPPGATLDAVVDDEQALPGLPAPDVKALEAPQGNDRLAAARSMAKDNPAAVASIVRGWVNGEQPA